MNTYPLWRKYVLRTYCVWRTWELSYLGVVVFVIDEIEVGGCSCTHLFRVVTNLFRTYVPGMAYLRVIVGIDAEHQIYIYISTLNSSNYATKEF